MMCAAAALGLHAATSRMKLCGPWTAAAAAAALNIRDTLVYKSGIPSVGDFALGSHDVVSVEFDEVLVTTTLSPSK